MTMEDLKAVGSWGWAVVRRYRQGSPWTYECKYGVYRPDKVMTESEGARCWEDNGEKQGHV